MEKSRDGAKKTETNTVKKASVKMIEECDATGIVKDIYDDIKASLGIDFVPNMYRAMAAHPPYLETNWKKIQSVMNTNGKLDRKTQDIIALTVSIMSGCEYCINVYNEAVKHAGLDDGALLEVYEIIDLYAGLNRLNIALQTQPDEKPWHGCGG